MNEANSQTRIRLDKWLWHARMAKTRTFAQKMISAGKVRVNGEKANASKRQVGDGDILTITGPRDIKILKVLACGEKRGSFTVAQLLYEDLSPPKETLIKEDKLSTEPVAGKRPDKRDRRTAQMLNGKGDLI